MKENEIRNREAYIDYLSLVEQDAKIMLRDKAQFMSIDCPACASKNHVLEFKKINFSYHVCRDCDTLFVTPRPNLKQLEEFYRYSPSALFWVEKFFKPVAESRRQKIFRPRAEKIADMIRKENRGKLKIAEIGAGFGLFLEELNKIMSGLDLTAIEPSKEMAGICKDKGLAVKEELVENIKEKEAFDILVCFELIEHLFSPRDFFIKVNQLLKKNGSFHFSTLNGEGFDIQILWENSKSIFPPHHLNFFNTGSIKSLVESCGFKVIKMETSGKLDWDIVETAYTYDKADIGRFWKLVCNKGSRKAKEELQNWIGENGFSSHMEIIIKK